MASQGTLLLWASSTALATAKSQTGTLKHHRLSIYPLEMTKHKLQVRGRKESCPAGPDSRVHNLRWRRADHCTYVAVSLRL